jgi:hypothetical protein
MDDEAVVGTSNGRYFRLVPGQWFGRLPMHAHRNLLDEWEDCTDNDCEVYQVWPKTTN